MKIRILCIALIVAVAATGCLKNDQKPANNSTNVKNILPGSWTGGTSNIVYYDSIGNSLGSATVTIGNLTFDSQSNITETTTGANPTTVSGTYSLVTDASGNNFLITTGAVGAHTYAIASISTTNLTLVEQIVSTNSSVTTLNGKSITYYGTVQVSGYNKMTSATN
ncbi:MAG TPA: hypothetical protein VGM63_21020 [Mucilaginibacter sp.]|jgi:hypothetical protein